MTVDVSAIDCVAQVGGSGHVGANVVALHLVRRGAAAGDVNAARIVAGDDVACFGCRPADGVAGRAIYVHTVAGVTQIDGAGDVGANVVALDFVPRGVGTREKDAAIVGGDDVTRPSHRPSDGVAGRVIDIHAMTGVTQINGPAHVGADMVALNLIPRRAALVDVDAVLVIAGDQVARPGDCPADYVATATDADAAGGVAQVHGPGDVGSHVVTLHHARRAGDENAPSAVPGDDIAGFSRCPADGIAGSINHDAIVGVAETGGPGNVGADVVTLDVVSAGEGAEVDAEFVIAGYEVACLWARATNAVEGRVVDVDSI